MSKIVILTICLDGMPWLATQYAMWNMLKCDWRWIVVEGAAMNGKSSSWLQPQEPRFSNDGTSEFLQDIRKHPRITVIQKERWESKDDMCNAALELITQNCLLLQADSDEIWTPHQIETLIHFFEAYPQLNCARFFCKYFLGANIITTSENGYGNKPEEWLRAWRYEPGMRFTSHSPPIMCGMVEQCATREQTKECGLVFDHYAYATWKQVAYKEAIYGYKDATKHWTALQENTKWPAKLIDFLPWVDQEATADLHFK